MTEEISRVCKICLAVNLKCFDIQNKQLKALYKNIICAQFDFDFALEVGVEVGACYICYAQLLKIHKFSELAQTSRKRLQYLKDIGAKVSKKSIGLYNESSQLNLSITIIPPIYLRSTAEIAEEIVSSYPVSVKNEYIELDNIADDCQKSNNYIIEHPTLSMPPANISRTQRPMHTEAFVGTKIIQEDTHIKPITEDHIASVEKHNEHNIGDNCEKFKAYVNDNSLTMSPANSSLSQSSKQTKPLVGTKRKGSDLSNLLEQKKRKIDSSELRFENDIAVTNTPITRNNRELANNIDKRKTKIEELIKKLIEIHKQAMNTNNKNGSSQKQPTWCDHSQLLLIQLIKLAGSEYAGSMLLLDRVFPLFPQGFLRVPSLSELLEMAGYKTNIVPCELYLKTRKDYKVDESTNKVTSVKSVGNKLPSQELIKTILSPTSIDNQVPSMTVTALPLPVLKATKFSVSNALDFASKRDIKCFVPVKTLNNRIVISKETGISASESKQPASAINETNNEIMISNVVSLSVPEDTSGINKSQEKNVVKIDDHNEIKQINAIFLGTHQNASKLLQDAVSSVVLKETSNISKSQEQNVVKINNHERISSISYNKIQQKSTHTSKQPGKDKVKCNATHRYTDSVHEAMLNKLSKFKEKLDSQYRDYNSDSSSDIEIIESN